MLRCKSGTVHHRSVVHVLALKSLTLYIALVFCQIPATHLQRSICVSPLRLSDLLDLLGGNPACQLHAVIHTTSKLFFFAKLKHIEPWPTKYRSLGTPGVDVMRQNMPCRVLHHPLIRLLPSGLVTSQVPTVSGNPLALAISSNKNVVFERTWRYEYWLTLSSLSLWIALLSTIFTNEYQANALIERNCKASKYMV